jgi:hypothetical protein
LYIQIKKVDIESFIKARIQIRPKRCGSGSDQKDPNPQHCSFGHRGFIKKIHLSKILKHRELLSKTVRFSGPRVGGRARGFLTIDFYFMIHVKKPFEFGIGNLE